MSGMNRRNAIASLLGTTATIALPARAATTAPRQSPEFTLMYLSGATEKLSKYRGNVCLVEFLYTTCSHCQHTSQVFSKLQNEFGTQGFQAIGVAFNPMAHMLVPDFLKDFKPSFPIAHAERGPVMQYLGLTETERFVVPQVALIDRAGVIQLQSPPTGDANLQDEAFLRKEIAKLVAKPGRAVKTSSAAKPVVARPASVSR